jgi:flavin-dependent dehydrogenase
MLSRYERRLKETFVLNDMYASRNMAEFLDDEDLFSYYPKSFPDLLEKVMWFGKGPKDGIGKTMWKEMKSIGMLSLRRLKKFYKIKNI